MNLSEMTIAELKAFAEEKNIDVSGCSLKAEYIATIELALGEVASNNNEIKFSKAQLRDSKKFSQYKDILAVVLEEDKSYSIAECNELINDFLNKEVE